ncbi:MAG: polysaccharide biosynthesis/export family protein [Planctomycetota bacterium]|nr:polysaccharide biosynthesis/export family protein [Planctomycetota bacterium]
MDEKGATSRALSIARGIGLALMLFALLPACRSNDVPFATSADVWPERPVSPRPPRVEAPPAAGSPPEIEFHLIATTEAETLSRIAAALGETPEEMIRQNAFFLVAPGDTLSITVLLHPDLSRETLVAPDGSIAMPNVGSISVGGSSIDTIEREIARRLSAFLAEPQVGVSLKTAAPRQVTVIGSLPQAGQVELVGQHTLLEALTKAGMQRPTGSGATTVQLIRKGRHAVIDLMKLYSLDAAGFNIRLKPNDIVMLVEPLPIAIVGSVNKPGSVFADEKGYRSILEGLALAGSITDRADLSRAQIIRRNGQVEQTDLNDSLFGPIAQDDTAGVKPVTPCLLYPGDTLLVPATREIGVYVLGMVARPGLVRGKDKMTVLQALAMAGPERFGAVLTEAKVVRGFPQKPKVLSIDVDRLMYQGDLAQNVILAEGDIVFVPESIGSDVIDTLNRVLAPITGSSKARAEYVSSQEAWNALSTEE